MNFCEILWIFALLGGLLGGFLLGCAFAKWYLFKEIRK
jgi:hypothetical protein